MNLIWPFAVLLRCISAEQYLAIKHAFTHCTVVTKTRLLFLSALAWIAAVLPLSTSFPGTFSHYYHSDMCPCGNKYLIDKRIKMVNFKLGNELRKVN